MRRVLAADQSGDRSSLNNGSTARHVWDGGPCHMEVPVDVGPKRLVPLFEAQVFQTVAVFLESCVVDQDVETAKFRAARFDCACTKLCVGHIARKQNRALSFALDGGGGHLGIRALFSKINQSHIRTLAGEQHCDAATDAGISACDQRDFAIELP
jgi:hypothetical protein